MGHKTLVRKLKPIKTKRQTNVHKTLVRKLKPNKTKRQTQVHKTLVRKLKHNIAKNKNLVYDHPMNISAKFDSNLFCGFRKKDENVKFP